MKKSFILYTDSAEIFEQLSDEEAGQLIKAFFRYNTTGNLPETDRALRLLFLSFKTQFDRDDEKYQTKIERNKENGSRGGRPRKNREKTEKAVGKTETEKTRSVLKKANESEQFPEKRPEKTKAKKAYSDSVSDSVSDICNVDVVVDVIDNTPVSRARTREEWRALIDKQVGLDNCLRASEATDTADVYKLVLDTILDVLTFGETVTLKGIDYGLEYLGAVVERMARDTLSVIITNFYEYDEAEFTRVRKKISNPKNYIFSILIAKDENSG